MSSDDRRNQILIAAERVATNDGLEKLTMRSAASAAGVSLRLVQYYFGSKSALMEAVLSRFSERSIAVWRAQADSDAELTAQGRLRAFLDAALPLDDDRRTFHRFGVSFASLALNDPKVGESAYLSNLASVESVLGHLIIDAAKECGAGSLDVKTEARELMSLLHGLGTMIMVGYADIPEAERVVDSFLTDKPYFEGGPGSGEN